jgi:tetratricopeptide (TPR) repeat protein
LSKEDLERLRSNIGGLLSFNSFLSTTAVENVAKSFVVGIDENDILVVGVIFEIDVDTSMKTSSPFASIDHLSIINEAENLFSMSTVFRIDEVKQFEDGFWHVQLTMTTDDDKQLRQLSEYIRCEYLGDPSYILELQQVMVEVPQDFHLLESFQNMLKFVSLMSRIGQYDNAQRILLSSYINYFGKDSIDSTNPLYSFEMIMNSMECVTKDRSKFESYLQRVEDILIHSPPYDKYKLADLYRFAASNTKQPDRALGYSMRYFELLKETNRVTNLEFITHHIRIGKIYFLQDCFADALLNYELALQKALELQLPTNPLLGECYNEIGSVYQKLGDFEKALEYHKKGLDISYKSLPPTHSQLSTGHTLCATSLMVLNRYEEAMQHFEKATQITASKTGHEPVTEAIQKFAKLCCRPPTDPCDCSGLEELLNRFEKLSE